MKNSEFKSNLQLFQRVEVVKLKIKQEIQEKARNEHPSPSAECSAAEKMGNKELHLTSR